MRRRAEEVRKQEWTPQPHGKTAKRPDRPGLTSKRVTIRRNRIGTDRLTPVSHGTKGGACEGCLRKEEKEEVSRLTGGP
jgi:hypothetical protein